jgi:hypothetical protein
MANEPERPIETLLRAAAKKRRDDAGAPLELHPADRRLLQAEVAKRFAQPEPAPRSFATLVAQLWPRLAWGVGILAILGLSVWLLLPMPRQAKSKALLARNQSAYEATPAREPSPAPAAAPAMPAPSPSPLAEKNPLEVASVQTPPPAQTTPASPLEAKTPLPAKDTAVGPTESPTRARLALAASAPAPGSGQLAQMQLAAPGEPPPATLPAQGGANYRARYGLAGTLVPSTVAPRSPAAPPVAVAPAPAAAVAVADQAAEPVNTPADQAALQYKSLAAAASANRATPGSAAMDRLSGPTTGAAKGGKALAVTQRFVQAPPAPTAHALLADRAAPTPAVLASFQVEQTGSQLRIVDGDGSVYSGYLQPAGAKLGRRAVRTEAPAVAESRRAPGAPLARSTGFGPEADRLTSLSYTFRVTGTNRSLNRKIVFTGNLLTATNPAFSPPALTNQGPGGVLERYQAVPAQPAPLPLLNSRISGKVVIGADKPVEINALPANP